MRRRVEVAPSILSADFAKLGDEIRAVEPVAGRIHIDVMDGHFVPNLSLGPMVVEALRPVTNLPLEVHLMVEEPGSFIEPFSAAGADRIVFHVETSGDPRLLSAEIRRRGLRAGIAMNPETSFERVVPHLSEVDLLVFMTVSPGFGGQRFIEGVLKKVEQGARALNDRRLDVDIEVDGGIDAQTAPRARAAGANIFVAGHSVYRSGTPRKAVEAILEAVDAGG